MPDESVAQPVLPSRRAVEEAVADLDVWRDSMHVSVCTLLDLADRVLALQPASDEEIEGALVAADDDGPPITPRVAYRLAESRSLAAILCDGDGARS